MIHISKLIFSMLLILNLCATSIAMLPIMDKKNTCSGDMVGFVQKKLCKDLKVISPHKLLPIGNKVEVYFYNQGSRVNLALPARLCSATWPPIVTSGQNPKSILGSWKVGAIAYEYADTTIRVDSIPYGRFIFLEDTYALVYNPYMAPRNAFNRLSKPDTSEIISGFRTIAFNSGQYRINGDDIIVTPDIAKVPGFEGGTQVFRYTFTDENNLKLSMHDETYPDGTKPQWYGNLKINFYLKRE